MKTIDVNYDCEAFMEVEKAFDVLENLFHSSHVQRPLLEIGDITYYQSKRRGLYIGRHKVLRRPGSPGGRAQLRLGGRWLENAGFRRGERFQAITFNGILLIVPLVNAPAFDLYHSAA